MPQQRLHQALNALVDGTRLSIRYRDYDQHVTKRTISPQRLVYYRDNWYLDVWCHLRTELRTFSLARIEFCATSNEKIKQIDDADLDDHFKTSYGVFAGTPKQTATLRFLPRVAREIASQRWHPDQIGYWEGHEFVLAVPYSEPHELLQDILKHLPHVIVEEPGELREQIRGILQASMQAIDDSASRIRSDDLTIDQSTPPRRGRR